MKCKNCGSQLRVIRTITLDDLIIRYRKCPKCDKEFITEEKLNKSNEKK
ncbi:MAG: hypothetical protein PHW38_05855 [Candidatus Cloacimonetes bacterium]|jgi:transcriptional regulator NrdR family protein